MADLKMPEINYVIVAGNLTKDPVYRQTTNNTPVVKFFLLLPTGNIKTVQTNGRKMFVILE